MANTIVTNKLATLVALGIAKKAAFLKVGSASYFADQIKSTARCGVNYEFIIPSSGSVVKGLAVAGSQFTDNSVNALNTHRAGNDIDERRVQLSIENYNNSLHADAMELAFEATDMEKWAEGYAVKIANTMIKDAVEGALPKSAVAFVGKGWSPLANASAYLASISSDEIYGFVNPNIQATLAANGQQFVPNGAPDTLYSKGELGIFQNCDYHAERFLGSVKVTAEDVGNVVSASIVGNKITLTGTSALKKNLVYTIDGVYACDMVGMATENLKSFVIPASADGKTSVEYDVVTTGSNKEVSIEGTAATTATLLLEEGSYKLGLLRTQDAFNFTPANKLEFKFASKENAAAGGVDGIEVAIHAFTKGDNADNLVRFDVTSLFGVIDSRCIATIFIKD